MIKRWTTPISLVETARFHPGVVLLMNRQGEKPFTFMKRVTDELERAFYDVLGDVAGLEYEGRERLAGWSHKMITKEAFGQRQGRRINYFRVGFNWRLKKSGPPPLKWRGPSVDAIRDKIFGVVDKLTIDPCAENWRRSYIESWQLVDAPLYERLTINVLVQ